MKPLISALIGIVVALAGGSVYLTWQLGVERLRAAQAEMRVAELAPDRQQVSALRSRLLAADMLTDEQTATLTQILQEDRE